MEHAKGSLVKGSCPEGAEGSVLRRIAPCSLCCHTCPAMKDGEIAQTAARLRHYLIGYDDFYRTILPVDELSRLDTIQAFLNRLDKLSNPKCSGCRDNTHGKCCINGCFFLECTQQHGVNFCAECPEFPCVRVPESGVFQPTVVQEWLDGSRAIREKGAEAWCTEACAQSHYLPFAKEEPQNERK